MGLVSSVESVPVAEALSRADTLKVSCDSLIRALLPALEPMEGKRHITNEAIQRTFTNKIIEVQLLGKTARTKIILSPETT